MTNKIANIRTAGALAVVALFFAATIPLRADPATEAQNLLTFCLAHPEACSISIDYGKGSQAWHIDYNGTRLNPLASTMKVVHLIAYADAAGKNLIIPSQAVSLQDWGQFWIGRDGGALAAAYARLSAGLPTHPATFTNDQLVSAMIQESDNAAPDYLLNKLGCDFFADTIARYIAGFGRVGYVDLPQSINAVFTSWAGNPADPNSGIRSLSDYSGYAADEYRAQVDQIFQQMHNPAFMSALRVSNGSSFPWVTGPPPPPPFFPLSEGQYETLTKSYFMRSNTRTYNQLMRGLLLRNVLPPTAQGIVEKFLEYDLTLPNPNPLLAPLDRYGVKDGSFSTYNGTTVRTRTIYAENKDGTQVVFTVHLTGTPGSPTDLGSTSNVPGSLDSAVRYFALALATNPTFAAQVQNTLGAKQDPIAPSLVARIVVNTSTAQQVSLTVAITNVGTAPTRQILNAGLYLTNDTTVRGTAVAQAVFPPLLPGATWLVELGSHTLGTNKYFELVVDPTNAIPASEKQDDPQFEIIPGH